jgi:hypothetical protein
MTLNSQQIIAMLSPHFFPVTDNRDPGPEQFNGHVEITELSTFSLHTAYLIHQSFGVKWTSNKRA